MPGPGQTWSRPRIWIFFACLYVVTFVLVATIMFILDLVVPLLPWIPKPYDDPDPPPLVTAFYCANLIPAMLLVVVPLLYISGGTQRRIPFLSYTNDAMNSAHKRASHLLHRRLSEKTERLAMIVGAVVGWILLALLYRFTGSRYFIFGSVLSGPCLLLLTYFAFGGDIPLKLRQKGYHRYMLIGVVFWISFAVAVVVGHFLHVSTELIRADTAGIFSLVWRPHQIVPDAAAAARCRSRPGRTRPSPARTKSG